jgi:hypothetical protein
MVEADYYDVKSEPMPNNALQPTPAGPRIVDRGMKSIVSLHLEVRLSGSG